jgi:hypothetical protein
VTIGDGKKRHGSGTLPGWTVQLRKVLHQLCSRKQKEKKLSVQVALKENRWIAHISPLIRPQEIKEYVALWEFVGHTQLQENMKDSICWRWTTDGEYTAKSAYLIQFQGTFSKLKPMPIWKAKAEPKCRFFAWTLLHKKILTPNNLIKRN